jgi:5-methylcytosine-specific restriction protein A
MILARDPYCRIGDVCDGGARSVDVDHIVPRRAGGSDDPSNLQGACHACHSRKTARADGGFGRARGRQG